MKSLRQLLSLGIFAAALSAGCYHVEVVSGAPLGQPAPGHQDRLHHGAFSGIIEIGGRYNLDQLCPQGWGSVSTGLSVITGALNVVVPIYSPQTISITCAEGAGGAPAASYKAQMQPDGTAKVLAIK